MSEFKKHILVKVKIANKENKEPAYSEESIKSYNKILDLIDVYYKHLGSIENADSYKTFHEYVENKIMDVIDQDESVLNVVSNNLDESIQERVRKLGARLFMENTETIGDFALGSGMLNVVSRVLDNEEASTHQNKFTGMNIGMQIAQAGYPRLTEKALDNKVASVQQDKIGKNIGMYAVKGCDQNGPALKALENPKASVQQDLNGLNIGMYAAHYTSERSFREKDIVVLKALDNSEASLQQDKYGYNIGMHAMQNCADVVCLKALQNKDACLQQEYDKGNNMSKIAAISERDEVVYVALDNEDASLQQNSESKNLGDVLKENKQNKRSLNKSVALGYMTKEEAEIDTIFILKDEEHSLAYLLRSTTLLNRHSI